MRDLHANARTPPNLDGLVERHEQTNVMAALIAHVRGVELATCCCDRGQVDDLFQTGIVARRIKQPGGKSHRTGIEALGHQGLHPGQARFQAAHAASTAPSAL